MKKNLIIAATAAISAVTAGGTNVGLEDLDSGFNTDAFATEGVALTPTEEAAAQAALGISVTKEVPSLESLSVPTDAVVVGGVVSDFNRGNTIDAVKQHLSMEGFDGQQVSNDSQYQLAFNIASAVQVDAVAELFFPTVIGKPNEAGVEIRLKKIDLVVNSVRSANGSVNSKVRKSFSQALRENSLNSASSTRLYPVYRTGANGTDGFLAGDYKVTIEQEGETFETAPILFGKKVDLLSISQTPNILAAGGRDQTDVLDAAGKVERILVKLVHDETNGHSYGYINVANINGSRFEHTVSGDSKDISVKMDTENVVIDANNFKLVDGSTLASKVASAADLKLIFKVNYSGSGNTTTGALQIYGNEFALVGAVDANGEAVSAGTLTTLKSDFPTTATELFAYELEARSINSNARSLGTIIDASEKVGIYKIPHRAPVTVMGNVITTGNESGDQVITNTAFAVSAKQSEHSLSTLVSASNTIKFLAGSASNGDDFSGIGGKLVKPYYKETTLDVGAGINSLSSKDRVEDVAGVIISKIRSDISEMNAGSGYKFARQSHNGDRKIKVIIGCDENVAAFLYGKEDQISSDKDVVIEIAGTPSEAIADTVYISYGKLDNSNEIDVLAFGFHGYIPELMTTLSKPTNGNNAVKVNIVVPRYDSEVNIPVLTKINIVGMDAISGKK